MIKKIIPFNERPKCEVKGCCKTGQHTGNYRKDGYPIFRKKCGEHHFTKLGINGWEYKQYRKKYCQNRTGKILGFKCTATIIDYELQLDVDHIDGNPSNNNPKNLQTLCKNCHSIKTHRSKDYLTAGRKALKIA